MYQILLKDPKFPVFANGKVYITYGYMCPEYGAPHNGTDLVPGGVNIVNDVVSIDNGTVTYVKDTVKTQLALSKISHPDALGNNIKISHDNGYESRYCHLAFNSICVKNGQKVKKGEKIATIGSTGVSSGLHLHFEIRLNDQRINPEPFIMGTQTFGNKSAIKLSEYPTKITTDALNIRETPDVHAKIVATIPKGKTVAIVGEYVWRYVEYDNKNGWCVEQYLK